MSLLSMEDSRGKKTRTLVLVWAGLLAVTLRYLLGGIIPEIPVTPSWEYAAAASTIVSWWLGREWMEKK